MSQIEIGPDRIQIDAEIVAKALGMVPHEMRDAMREGTVTSRFERGEGSDAGRVRLTFFSASRRARITADTTGAILSCTAVDYGGSPGRTVTMPHRRPGAASASRTEVRDRMDAMLDSALEGTFPASDPIAMSFDTPR